MTPKEKLQTLAENLNVSELSNNVLLDKRFIFCSGSSKEGYHHYGDGQLCQHVLEVVEILLLNNEYFSNPIDKKEVYLSALFHDYGKLWDYEKVGTKWESTEHKYNIHHISRSAIEWSRIAQEVTDKYPEKYSWLTEEVKNNILHAILSHHQLRQWGSPVSPNTQLAWLIHLADSISARMSDGEGFTQRLYKR